MSRGRIFRPTYTKDGEKRESRVFWMDFSVDGRRIRESTGTRDREAAERYLTRRLRELDVYGPREQDYRDVRLADLSEAIKRDYERNDRRSSIGNRLSYLHDFFGEDFRVFRLGDAQVDAYVAHRLEEGAANATVNRELACLRRMLNLGEKMNLVAPGAAPDVSNHTLSENNVRKGFVTPAEFQKLKVALPARVRPFVTFAFITGWRKSELLSRDWRHVDLEDGWIRLPVGESKSGEGRQFPLISTLRDVLEEQRERKEEVEREYDCVVDALFFYYEPQKNGTPAGARIKSFRRAWDSARTAIGKPDLIVHDLRRSAARQLVRSGVPENVVMRLCGWETRSVFERYAIVTEHDLREQSAKLDAHLQRQPDGKEMARNREKVETPEVA